jgi:hypothetical protein
MKIADIDTDCVDKDKLQVFPIDYEGGSDCEQL